MSYFSRPGEDRTAHHPSKGMDGDMDTCYVSGYHTAPWWQVTFQKEYIIKEVDVYGKSALSSKG